MSVEAAKDALVVSIKESVAEETTMESDVAEKEDAVVTVPGGVETAAEEVVARVTPSRMMMVSPWRLVKNLRLEEAAEKAEVVVEATAEETAETAAEEVNVEVAEVARDVITSQRMMNPPSRQHRLLRLPLKSEPLEGFLSMILSYAELRFSIKLVKDLFL